jgi:hypothetical protein
MTNRPVYHITHVNNVANIIHEDRLWCDSQRIVRSLANTNIGYSHIKERRMRHPVTVAAGGTLGNYVPFNFCPRSVMLYVIHRANDPDLAYRGGQGPILHLEADLEETLAWAEAEGRRWAVTPANAGAVYTDFWASRDQLNQLNWAAIRNDDFRSSEVKERKQAEFLMHDSFPWHLVRKIGVRSADIQAQVEALLAEAEHHPPVEIRADWYF